MGEASTPSDNHVLEDTPTFKFPKILIGKKILLATESYGPVNGVSKTTQNLVSYLRSQGVNIAVVAPEISTLASPSPPSTTNANEIEVRLKGYPLPYDPTLSVVYPFRLSKLFKRTFGEEPDLIYLASPASLGFQILLQHRLSQPSSPSTSNSPFFSSAPNSSSQIPVLLNFQTDLSGYCEILFPSPLDKWAVLVFRSVQGYLFNHPSVRTVFYPSGFVRRYLEQAGVQPRKMVNLRRGVDGNLFHPGKRDEGYRKNLAPNGEVILVSVSRIAPEKGFGFLAKVAKSLDAQGFPFKLLIVGGNRNPQVVGEIQDLFGNLLEDGKVIFTGMLKGENLARVYASADVFLHCSVTETFGLVVLESMSSGVPVIARDEGGPSEIVADGSSGYLVPPGDLEGFVERVVELGGDKGLRGKMGRKSREMAEGATWESIGNKVAWEMAGILEERGRGAPTEIDSSSTVGKGLATAFAYSWEVCGMGVIVGVWGGLVVTWGLVKVSLGIKGVLGRIKRVLGLK